jgi:hypothetical protein
MGSGGLGKSKLGQHARSFASRGVAAGDDEEHPLSAGLESALTTQRGSGEYLGSGSAV